MENLKVWVLSTAVASLIAGFVYILAPKGSNKKIVRVAIFTFILCSSLSPFFTGDFEFDFSLPELTYDSEKEVDLIESYQNKMEKLVAENMNEILKGLGVDDASIKIITDKKADNGISITETIITVPKKHMNKSEQIREKIKSELGYDVRVTV